MPTVTLHGKASRGYYGLAKLQPGINEIAPDVWATVLEIDKGQRARTGHGMLSGDLAAGVLEVSDGSGGSLSPSLASLALADAKDAIANCSSFELVLELYDSERGRKRPRSTLLSAALGKAKQIARAETDPAQLAEWGELAAQSSQDLGQYMFELLPPSPTPAEDEPDTYDPEPGGAE